MSAKENLPRLKLVVSVKRDRRLLETESFRRLEGCLTALGLTRSASVEVRHFAKPDRNAASLLLGETFESGVWIIIRDDRGLRYACVLHANTPAWNGTRLAEALAPLLARPVDQEAMRQRIRLPGADEIPVRHPSASGDVAPAPNGTITADMVMRAFAEEREENRLILYLLKRSKEAT
jgi:hypothetical protein